MEPLVYSEEELFSLKRLHVFEQNLDLSLNSKFSFFNFKGDMYVIIGNDLDYNYFHRDGQLLCGIVEIKRGLDNGRGIYLERLVLPFSSKILFAKFDPAFDQVLVVFKNENKIEKELLELHEGKILPQDFEHLLDDDYPLVEPLGSYHDVTEMKMPTIRK